MKTTQGAAPNHIMSTTLNLFILKHPIYLELCNYGQNEKDPVLRGFHLFVVCLKARLLTRQDTIKNDYTYIDLSLEMYIELSFNDQY